MSDKQKRTVKIVDGIPVDKAAEALAVWMQLREMEDMVDISPEHMVPLPPINTLDIEFMEETLVAQLILAKKLGASNLRQIKNNLREVRRVRRSARRGDVPTVEIDEAVYRAFLK
jgi:hypothetical protein